MEQEQLEQELIYTPNTSESKSVGWDDLILKSDFDPHRIAQRAAMIPPASYVLDRNVADEKAEEEDLVLLEGNDNTLQLDFDSNEAYEEFLEKRLPTLINFDYSGYRPSVKRVVATESKSGNKHVYVHLHSALPRAERIALQMALGSDMIRETLNLMAHINGLENGILLFETQKAVPVVIYAVDGYQPQLTDGNSSYTAEPQDVSSEFEQL